MSPIAASGIAVLVFLSLYRRFRRLFGRQRINPGGLRVRIGLLLAIGALLLLRGSHDAMSALAVAGGLAGGVLLALVGLRLTRFEHTPQGSFHTPHGGIGLLLSALLVGRLAWRGLAVWPSFQAAQSAGTSPLAVLQRNPLTSAIFALLIGYYLAYSIGILLQAGRASATGAPPPPTAL